MNPHPGKKSERVRVVWWVISRLNIEYFLVDFLAIRLVQKVIQVLIMHSVLFQVVHLIQYPVTIRFCGRSSPLFCIYPGLPILPFPLHQF